VAADQDMCNFNCLKKYTKMYLEVGRNPGSWGHGPLSSPGGPIWLRSLMSRGSRSPLRCLVGTHTDRGAVYNAHPLPPSLRLPWSWGTRLEITGRHSHVLDPAR